MELAAGPPFPSRNLGSDVRPKLDILIGQQPPLGVVAWSSWPKTGVPRTPRRNSPSLSSTRTSQLSSAVLHESVMRPASFLPHQPSSRLFQIQLITTSGERAAEDPGRREMA